MPVKFSSDQIKNWVTKHFDDYKESKGGAEIRVNNPFGSDDGYHLWINVDNGIVNDFRPGYKELVAGSFVNFVSKYLGVSRSEAVKDIAAGGEVQFTQGISQKKKEKEAAECGAVELPSGFVFLDKDNSASSEHVRRYLGGRVVDSGLITKYGVGRCGLDVVFPYFENFDVVYWQSRSTVGKVFNFPKGTNKSAFVYGIDDIDYNRMVVVCESIFNCLMFDNGVAIGGCCLDRTQIIKLLNKGVKSVCLAFDNDDAGKAGTFKAAKMFPNDVEIFFSFPLVDMDWNDLAQFHGIEDVGSVFNHNLKSASLSNLVSLRVNS